MAQQTISVSNSFTNLVPQEYNKLIRSIEEFNDEQIEEEPQDYTQQLTKLWHDDRINKSDRYMCDCCVCHIPEPIVKRSYTRKKKKEYIY